MDFSIDNLPGFIGPKHHREPKTFRLQTDDTEHATHKPLVLEFSAYKVASYPNGILIHIVAKDPRTETLVKYLNHKMEMAPQHIDDPVISIPVRNKNGTPSLLVCQMKKATKYPNLIEIVGKTTVKENSNA